MSADDVTNTTTGIYAVKEAELKTLRFASWKLTGWTGLESSIYEGRLRLDSLETKSAR